MRVVFFALGTWGDFLPMWRVARGFALKFPTHDVLIASHAALRHQHQTMKTDCIQNLAIAWLAIPVQEVINHEQEFALLKQCCEEPQADAIVFNLCAIAAYHLAEWLAVPCVAFHAGANPPEHPQFISRLRRHFPDLYARFQHAESPQATLAELTHWMTPIWGGVYTRWRESLGLSDVPLQLHVTWPVAIPLLYAVSPTLLQPPGLKDHDKKPIKNGGTLGYWPSSIQVVGHLLDDSVSPPENGCSQALQAFLLQCGEKLPVYMGFGSMKPWEKACCCEQTNKRARTETTSLDSGSADPLAPASPSPSACTCALELFNTLAAALDELKLPGIFHNIPCDHNSNPNILVLEGFVDLAWLFPRCSVVLHHGGAGTVTQAIISRMPQVICPVEFDQPFWATRIEHLGLGHRSTLLESWPSSRDAAGEARELAGVIKRAMALGDLTATSAAVAEERGLEASVARVAEVLGGSDFHHQLRYRTGEP